MAMGATIVLASRFARGGRRTCASCSIPRACACLGRVMSQLLGPFMGPVHVECMEVSSGDQRCLTVLIGPLCVSWVGWPTAIGVNGVLPEG